MSVVTVSAEYRDYLHSEKWAAIRNAICERDGYRCSVCGSNTSLQVHHIRGRYRFHEEKHPETLITLCDRCHETVHRYFKACDRLKEAYRHMTG